MIYYKQIPVSSKNVIIHDLDLDLKKKNLYNINLISY